MKKIISILLTLTIICTFSACNNTDISSKYEDNFQIEKESKPEYSEPDSIDVIIDASREDIKKAYIYEMNETLEQNRFSISNFKCAKSKKLPKWAKINEFSIIDSRYELLDKDNTFLSEHTYVVVEYDIKNTSDKELEVALNSNGFYHYNKKWQYIGGGSIRYIHNNSKNHDGKDYFFLDLAVGEIKHFKLIYICEDSLTISEDLLFCVEDRSDLTSKPKYFNVGVVPDLESLEE